MKKKNKIAKDLFSKKNNEIIKKTKKGKGSFKRRRSKFNPV